MSERHDPRLLEPGHLPTPFSAQQIREATPDGRRVVVRVEPAGQPAAVRATVFTDPDADGVTLVRTTLDADHAPVGEDHRERTTWLELQGHASFPADRSVLERVRLELGGEELTCLRYTVGDGDAVDQYWFAVERPGMPVLLESRRGPELVVRVTVVEDEVGPA